MAKNDGRCAPIVICGFLEFPEITLSLKRYVNVCCEQVRQPVICANHHVFCSSCMEMWLRKANQCPSCRVPITADNPCREIIGE